MDLHGKRLILGSQSPRRRELLAGLDLPFTVDTGNTFRERFSDDIPHPEIPALLARGKSHGFHRPLEAGEILITADTLVLCDDRLLGKPRDRQAAREMLRSLSGRTHQVVTAVTLRSLQAETTFSDTAQVHFKPLTDQEIDYYIEHFQPFDKAGAYGIQEWIGYMGIDRIEGSFYTIMGLPVHRVYEEFLPFLQETAL